MLPEPRADQQRPDAGHTASLAHSCRRSSGIGGRRAREACSQMNTDHRRPDQQRQQVVRRSRCPRGRRSAAGTPARAACPAPPATGARASRRRDGEGGDGVDLGLVGVLPVGEGERADDRRAPPRRAARVQSFPPCRRPSRRRAATRAPPGTRTRPPAALNVALIRLVRHAHSPTGSSVAQTWPISTKSGVPGGCGMPRIRIAAMNSPASQKVTVGARVKT